MNVTPLNGHTFLQLRGIETEMNFLPISLRTVMVNCCRCVTHKRKLNSAQLYMYKYNYVSDLTSR